MKMQVKTKLGEWLEEQRRAKGLTKGKAAELVGVSPAQYSSYEAGKSIPRSKAIGKIAKAFERTEEEVSAMLVPAQQAVVAAALHEGETEEIVGRIALLEAKVDYVINLLHILTKK